MPATPGPLVKLAFYLLAIRPRPEWHSWAEAVVKKSWPWIVGARVGFAFFIGAALLSLTGDFGWAESFGFALAFAVVMIPLAVSFNDSELARRREIARVHGIRRKGPAEYAAEGLALLAGGLALLTGGGRRWWRPTLNRLQWAVTVAMFVTLIWFFHERRAKDRDLGRESDTPPDSRSDRGEMPSASPTRFTNLVR